MLPGTTTTFICGSVTIIIRGVKDQESRERKGERKYEGEYEELEGGRTESVEYDGRNH